MLIENTTYSGIGKDFTEPADFECVEFELLDHEGKRVFMGEEYFALEKEGRGVLVHIEEVANFLDDERLFDNDWEQLIKLLEIHYNVYPLIM